MLLGAWLASKPLVGAIRQGQIGRGYPTLSWYCLLAGVGLFPEDSDLRAPTAQESQYDLDGLDHLLERSVLNFPDHREFLADIPATVTEKTFQVYQW